MTLESSANNILSYRRRHDPLLDRPEIAGDDGITQRPLARVLDPLDALVARGGLTADSAAYLAGDRFRRDFAVAGIDRLRVLDPSRGPGGNRRSRPQSGAVCLTDEMLDARDRLRAALTALGGPSSQPARVASWVLGMGAGLKQFAGGDLPGDAAATARRMDPRQAAGMLLATLEVLAGHYRRVDRHGLPKRRGLRAGEMPISQASGRYPAARCGSDAP